MGGAAGPELVFGSAERRKCREMLFVFGAGHLGDVFNGAGGYGLDLA